jgi:hypothetical protein
MVGRREAPALERLAGEVRQPERPIGRQLELALQVLVDGDDAAW